MWIISLVQILLVVLCHATDEELPPRPDLEPPPPLDSDMGVGKENNNADEEPPPIPDLVGSIKEGMMETGDFDGGDLRLTEEQRKIIYGEGPTNYGGSYKYAKLWDNGVVPYRFRRADFYSSEMREIRQAMNVYEQETCVRFVLRTNQENFVQLQDDKTGCNSYLGKRVGFDPQPLNLLSEGCMHFGTYLHELGHAIGLLHEHQLPNRDDHVKFFPENVDPKKFSQLKKYAHYMADLHGTGYDLSSITHYELTAFSKDRASPTLGIENPFMERHIGRRYSYLLSFGDVKTVNRMYSCGKHCTVSCPEPGFVNEKCECVTPESYNARVCVDDQAQAAWCDKKARRGQCDKNNAYQNKHCARTCDLCPRFLPGDSGLVKPAKCTNHYRDSAKCDKWAAEGTCKSYPTWMKRYCRKSCNACNEQIGVCGNKLSDSDCDGYANHLLWSYCTSPKSWGQKTRAQCPDSCKVCPK